MARRPPHRHQQSRLSAWAGRVGDRLGKSSRVFLAVLFVLVLVEVAVDWNATLFEINVLRSTLQLKAESTADLLRKAGEAAVLGYEWDELDRLSQGLFDDDEVVYVRFADVLGNTIYDRLRPAYATRFSAAHGGTSFRQHYRHVMARDVGGLLRDPERLREKMESSRHRDFIQAFTDGRARLVAWLTRTPPPVRPAPRVLYQDRLADERGALDRDLSYALGAVTAEDGERYGVVLVAFQHDRLNAAIASKLWKGAGITVFFVCLILVQNVSSRRGKLRMQRLAEALGAARAAVRSALPATAPALAGWDVGLAFAQAESLGGTVYDLVREDDRLVLFLAVPDGSGIDAALASLAVIDAWRRAPRPPTDDPAARLAAVLAGYAGSPLKRKVALLLVEVHPDGSIRGLAAGLEPPARLEGGRATPLTLGARVALDGPGADLLHRPAQRLAAGPSAAALAVWDDGVPRGLGDEAAEAAAARDVLADIEAVLAAGRDAADAAQTAVERAAARRAKGRAEDLFVLALRYSQRSEMVQPSER